MDTQSDLVELPVQQLGTCMQLKQASAPHPTLTVRQQGDMKGYLGNSGSISEGKDGAAGALHLQKLVRLQRSPVLLKTCCMHESMSP